MDTPISVDNISTVGVVVIPPRVPLTMTDSVTTKIFQHSCQTSGSPQDFQRKT